MSDLVERLRYLAGTSSQQFDPSVLLLNEAGDEIEQLTAENKQVRKDLMEAIDESVRLTAQLESGTNGQSMLPTELLDGMHERIAKLEAVVDVAQRVREDDDSYYNVKHWRRNE